MKTILHLVIIAAAFLQFSLAHSQDNIHNARNSLDYAGTYRGTLPCADCEGIETSLTLHSDGSYLLRTSYLGTKVKPLEQRGKFTWNTEGNTISFATNKNDTSRYFVGENTLIHLDKIGKRITGNLAEMYILHKLRDATLVDTKWVLVELRGKPVKSAEGKEPFIVLTREGSKLNGFGGCNTIQGSYIQQKGNRISFSKIVTTLRHCDAMATEDELLRVLNIADSYSIKGNSLQLNRARMAPSARFEAAE